MGYGYPKVAMRRRNAVRSGGGGGAAAPSYSAEALALFARMTTPPSTARKGLINAVIGALLAGPVSGSNIWAKLDAVHVMAAADSQAASLNWIAAAYDLTITGSPTFTADRGYTNASNSHEDTGFNPTSASSPKYVRDSACIGVWCRTDGGVAAPDMGATTLLRLQCISVGAGVTGSINSANTGIGNGNIFTTATDGIGLTTINRSSSTTVEAYRNGTALTITTGAKTSSGIPNSQITYGGAAAFGNTDELSAGFIGLSLTANEVLDIYNALQTYMTAIGA